MKLLTKEITTKLPPLYTNENKTAEETPIVVKFFDPCGSWTWFATEYDPDTRMFFGMVHGFEKELGYFSLDELESIRGALGLGIERDKYYGFGHMLSEVMEK